VAPALAALLVGAGLAAEIDKKPPKELTSFGTLRSATPREARDQALEWLKSVGKGDEKTLQAFNAIWDSEAKAVDPMAVLAAGPAATVLSNEPAEAPVLDHVTATLILGDADAAKLLEEARDAANPAPTAVPKFLTDSSKSAFYRANLALAYAKALSGRRIYEDALDVLRTTTPEQVVDPSSYLFYRAVAEHALQYRNDANLSIVRLLDDCADSPERYKVVSALMVYDMLGWQEKDMGWISRTMDNIERRLDQSRGGDKTKKMERDVIARLDEMIKQIENQNKGAGS
jgi:hypothetical protein